ncbi:MAG: hypothetical protein LBK60_07365 [Verrucomicrobiales bacterium]|jgi:hypothetical protein|nr:hypothetical protein [Verrucomicrobiales bacterium]
MKNKYLPLMLVAIGVLFFSIPDGRAATHVRVGVGVGIGAGYGHGYRHGYYPYRYRPHWHGGYYPYYVAAYWGPAVVYSTPVYVTAPATQTTTTTVTTTTSASPAAAAPLTLKATPPPYGIPQDNGQVQSPFSNFIISDLGMKPGTVVYDVYTGQPFRIP